MLENRKLAVLKGEVVRHGGGPVAPGRTRRSRPERTGMSDRTGMPGCHWREDSSAFFLSVSPCRALKQFCTKKRQGSEVTEMMFLPRWEVAGGRRAWHKVEIANQA